MFNGSTKKFIHALVTSQMDYYNIQYMKLPLEIYPGVTIYPKEQLTQFCVPLGFTHLITLLYKLHWLVSFWVQFQAAGYHL